MADTTVSQSTSTVNENSTISFDFLNGNIPAVSSLHISQHFNKKHKHVLRDIQDLRSTLPKSFVESNFGPEFTTVAAGNGASRRIPIFFLTRDAFSLLVMGFTGGQALKWKLKYIEAFNALESAVLAQRAELARESGYLQGKDEALCLPAVQAERQAGYLSGLTEGQRYRRKRDGLALLTRALGYKAKGLNQNEIARLLGIRKQRVSDLMARARQLGVAL